MLLGAHESTAGGLFEAFGRAVSDGAESVQIFTKSSRMWAAKAISADDAARFRAEGERTGLLSTCSVHASYLVNLGCDEGQLQEKSIAGFADELRRCEQLAVPYLVVHPGSHTDTERGLQNVADGLVKAFELAPGKCVVLLETAAGQGNALGRTFEELRAMRDAVPAALRKRVAVCLDTCHIWAAGYDWKDDYDAVWEQFDRALGLELLKAVHLNDSKKELGCRVDRHEYPGLGCIGEEAFARLVNDPRFAKIPAYLELPPEGNLESLARLRALRTGTPRTATGRKGQPRVARARARS